MHGNVKMLPIAAMNN